MVGEEKQLSAGGLVDHTVQHLEVSEDDNIVPDVSNSVIDEANRQT